MALLKHALIGLGVAAGLSLAGGLWSQAYVTQGRARVERNLVVAADGSGDYRTIQEAIDRAEFSARIRIRPGVYRENLLLKSFVNLEGAGIGRTVIVGKPDRPVVSAYNLGSAKISNLSFEFAAPSTEPVLLARYTSFTLTSCSFRLGRVGLDLAFHSAVNIRDCIVRNNSGDGIRLVTKSQGVVAGCMVLNNGGDGIVVADRSSPLIERNTIRHNGGAGVLIEKGSYGKIAGNYIFHNANGLIVRDESSPTIRNNTLVYHRRNDDHPESGFAILVHDGTAMAITNNNVTDNAVGIAFRDSGRQNIVSHNNLWANETPYINAPAHPLDVRHEPRYAQPGRFDFRLDSTSVLRTLGEGALAVGADFDYARSESKFRLDYLIKQANRELARENWYLAYQAAQEILTLEKDNTEGRSIFSKAADKLAGAYVEKARSEFMAENYRLAESFLRMAFSYDVNNRSALDLKREVDEAIRLSQMKFIFFLVTGGVAVFVAGFWIRRLVQENELKRQARWWLDDAEEHIELARAAEGDRQASEDFEQALVAFGEARGAMARRHYEAAEQFCNEAVRHASRARDAGDRFKQVRKDALYEVSNAENLMIAVSESELAALYPEEIKEFRFYLDRAQNALVQKHFSRAKEIAEDMQNAIRALQKQRESEQEQSVHDLIAETERRIIDALSSNSSTDIIIAVIDFKSELEILKNGFSNGQLSPEEVVPQIKQIKDFIEEALRLGAEDGSLFKGRKRNYYEILGIKEDATLEQIKAVYRKLCMIYHPDMNTDDELGLAGDERFKEIKEAYESLVSEKSKN